MPGAREVPQGGPGAHRWPGSGLLYSQPVGYRSGHNGIASKAIGGSRPPRVQIPPPPPRRAPEPGGARRPRRSRKKLIDARDAAREGVVDACAGSLRPGDVREWTNRHAWRACDLARGPRVQIPSSPPLRCRTRLRNRRYASESVRRRPSGGLVTGGRRMRSHPPRLSCRVAVLGGGFGVPCTGNPRHAGLNTRLRPVEDRAAPGKQRRWSSPARLGAVNPVRPGREQP